MTRPSTPSIFSLISTWPVPKHYGKMPTCFHSLSRKYHPPWPNSRLSKLHPTAIMFCRYSISPEIRSTNSSNSPFSSVDMLYVQNRHHGSVSCRLKSVTNQYTPLILYLRRQRSVHTMTLSSQAFLRPVDQEEALEVQAVQGEDKWAS